LKEKIADLRAKAEADERERAAELSKSHSAEKIEEDDWDMALKSIRNEFDKPGLQNAVNACYKYEKLLQTRELAESLSRDEDHKSTKEAKEDLQEEAEALAKREQSFRTNLQRRAQATRERSLRTVKFEEEIEQRNPSFAEGDEEQIHSHFVSRLERSIRLMSAVDSDDSVKSAESELPLKPDIPPNNTATPMVGNTPQADTRRKSGIPPTAETEQNSIKSSTDAEPASEGLQRSFGLTATAASAAGDDTEPSIPPKAVNEQTSTKKNLNTDPKTSINEDIERNGARIQKSVRLMNKGLGLSTQKSLETEEVIASRERSFHTDGWKSSINDIQGPDVVLTEEHLAMQELKAREAYIKAMNFHQVLVKSGKDESSSEVRESQRKLQICFAKIEYWENLKMKIKSNPDAFAPAVQNKLVKPLSSDIDEDEPGYSKSHTDSPCKDKAYIEAQELKAREDYIKAMQHHQTLVTSKQKPGSLVWVESEERQQACLAKLQYWESLNNETPDPPHNSNMTKMKNDRVKAKNPASSRPARQQERDENKNDKKQQGKKQTKKGVDQKPTKRQSQGGRSFIDTLCSFLLPQCTRGLSQPCPAIDDSYVLGENESTESTRRKSTPNAPRKKVVEKPSVGKPKNTKSCLETKSAEAGSVSLQTGYCCGTGAEGQQAPDAAENKAQCEAMRVIENEAKQILGTMSNEESASSVGGKEACTPKKSDLRSKIAASLRPKRAPEKEDCSVDEGSVKTTGEKAASGIGSVRTEGDNAAYDYRNDTLHSAELANTFSKEENETKVSKRKRIGRGQVRDREDDESEVSYMINSGAGSPLFCF
jgi:hypothetical protein